MKKTNKKKAATLTSDTDASLEILDAALTSAEEHLRKLLPGFPPRQIACVFSEHVLTHATEELSNITKHGHRNDDPADKPQDQGDLLRDVRAALDALLTQVYQMQGLFGDEDGKIAEAVSDAEDALERSALSTAKPIAPIFREARVGLIPSERTDDAGKIHLDVTNREWDVMLAALRLWQKDAAHIADPDGSIVDLACEHGDALSNEEVDALIVRLDCL